MCARERAERESAFGLRGECAGERFSFVLKRGENSVGAHASNEIVLPVRGVSRRHALLTCEDNALRVQDLGSKNGTFVNGTRVKTAELHLGDVLHFGPVRLALVTLDGADAEPVTASSGEARPARAPAPAGLPQGRSTASEDEMPTRWLTALQPWLGSGAAPGEAGFLTVLTRLTHAFEASGAALVEWSGGTELNVLCCAGALPEPAALERAREAASAAVERVGRDAPAISMLLDDPVPVAVVALARRGSSSKALLVVGEFPRRRACRPLLELLVRGLAGGQAEASPAPCRPDPSAAGDLVFPAGYVSGRSPAMQSVYHQLRHLVTGDIPLLLTGETGVGKEHVAHILHASSPRASGPFVAVNCAAIPTELLEVELFGIEAGVATGVTQREGKMQLASGGIIVLDEISDMSPALQSKLLRALQEKEVHPVGARRPVPMDAWVIAATNTDLLELVAQGRFRQDLYFRIAGYTLRVPPLRERREDIPELAVHFMQRFAQEVAKRIRGFTSRALDALVVAPWPGNVRELENEVRRLVYLCTPNQPITTEVLSPALLSPPLPGAAPDALEGDLNLQRRAEELERTLVLSALDRTRGKLSKTAELLGISRYGLRLKMRRLGIAG